MKFFLRVNYEELCMREGQVSKQVREEKLFFLQLILLACLVLNVCYNTDKVLHCPNVVLLK